MPKSTIGYYNNRLYVGPNWSTDGGSTWHNLGAEAVSQDTDLLGGVVVDPSTPTTLYMMSSRGVARSADDGLNWHDSVEGIAGVRVSGILQLQDKNTVFLGAQAGIARTADFLSESATWTYPIKVESRGFSVDAIALSPANPDRLIAAAGGRIYYSEDSGTTWSEATVPLVNRESVRRFTSTSEGAYSDEAERLVRRKAITRSDRSRTPGPIDGEHPRSERSDASQLTEFSSFVKSERFFRIDSPLSLM
jgi:hypothetical protein